jgi:hypothetical protein
MLVLRSSRFRSPDIAGDVPRGARQLLKSSKLLAKSDLPE